MRHELVLTKIELNRNRVLIEKFRRTMHYMARAFSVRRTLNAGPAVVAKGR
jgi:hypothetical protein